MQKQHEVSKKSHNTRGLWHIVSMDKTSHFQLSPQVEGS